MQVMHKKLPKNELGRDFIIGDLHGCYDDLCALIRENKFDASKDRLFSVGDLVDRGPNSMDCLSFLDSSWFHAVRGNHEQMLIDVVLNNEISSYNMYFMNGGGWIMTEDKEELLRLTKLAAALPIAITVETDAGLVGICHTDPPDDWAYTLDPEEHVVDQMLWGRSRIMNKDTTPIIGVVKTYHGHTPSKKVIRLGNCNFIDTGACFKDAGGFLTMEQI